MLLRDEGIEDIDPSNAVSVVDDFLAAKDAGVRKPRPSIRVPETVKAIIEGSPEPMALCDAAGTVMAANEPLYMLLDCDKRSVLGRSIYDAIKKLKPLTESGKAQGIRQYAIYRALTTGAHIRGVMTLIGTSPGNWSAIECSGIPLISRDKAIIGGLAIFKDVTMMGAFKEVGALSVSAANVEDMVEDTMDAIMNAFGLRTAWFYSYEASSGELRLKAIKGEHSGIPGMPAVENPDHAHHGIISAAFNKNKPILYRNYRKSTHVHAFDPLSRRRHIGSMACIPLYSGAVPIGVLAASTYLDRLMDDRTLTGLVRISGQLALGIERARNERMLIKEREKALAHLTALGEDVGRKVSAAFKALEEAIRHDRHNVHAERSLEILKDCMLVLDSVKKLTSVASIKPLRQPIDVESILTACAASAARCGRKRVTIACEGDCGEVYASPLLKEMLAYIIDCIVKCAGNDVDVRAGISPGYHDGKKHVRVSIEYNSPCPDIARVRALAGNYGIKLWLEKEDGKDRAVMLLPSV